MRSKALVHSPLYHLHTGIRLAGKTNIKYLPEHSHLLSQLLGRLRSGGSWFKASPGKKFMRPYLYVVQLVLKNF
jgi:trans-aconitate methyltransferase